MKARVVGSPLTAGVAAFVLSASAILAGEAGPVFSPSGPDAAAYGEAQHYPASASTTHIAQSRQVGSSADWDQRFPTHPVARPAKPWTFRRASPAPQIHYQFGGKACTPDDLLARVPVTGLLLIKDDTILYEHYQYARTDRQRLVSNSMAKTIVAMLVGVAIADGRIHSVRDKAGDYVPALRGSLYGDTTLRALLQMSSGIAEEARIEPGTKRTYQDRFWDELFAPGADAGISLAKFDHREAAAGTHFHYSSADNEAVTTVLRRAVGRPLASYLAEKIWQPMGAEADAAWAVDASGQETGPYGFNAVLRDYGRLGRLLAHDGQWERQQLVPREWVLEATTLHTGDFQVMPGTAAYYYGYGYQVWILPGQRRMFALIGAGGQYVFVDPLAKLVLVQTAVRYDGTRVTSPRNESLALWRGLVNEFGGKPE
jgi:CubicO group peptidase (beta-lactamase class C family)